MKIQTFSCSFALGILNFSRLKIGFFESESVPWNTRHFPSMLEDIFQNVWKLHFSWSNSKQQKINTLNRVKNKCCLNKFVRNRFDCLGFKKKSCLIHGLFLNDVTNNLSRIQNKCLINFLWKQDFQNPEKNMLNRNDNEGDNIFFYLLQMRDSRHKKGIAYFNMFWLLRPWVMRCRHKIVEPSYLSCKLRSSIKTNFPKLKNLTFYPYLTR